MNFSKSCIVFNRNTNKVTRHAVSKIFDANYAVTIVKYLGLPMGISWYKKKVFSFIEFKLRHRMGG